MLYKDISAKLFDCLHLYPSKIGVTGVTRVTVDGNQLKTWGKSRVTPTGNSAHTTCNRARRSNRQKALPIL